MAEELLREDDLQQIRARGVGVDDVRQQLAILRNPPPYTRLLRACAAGDGIRILDEAEIAAALSAHERAAGAGRFTCFVPASGAATRMFRALLALLEREPKLDATRLEQLATGGDKDAPEVRQVWTSLDRFAFVPSLRAALAQHGVDLGAAVRAGDVATVLGALLHEHGLDYASLPKGLLAFHRAAEGPRTACEEHLVDAASYARASDGAVRLHFTVSPQHLDGFRALLARVQAEHERRLGVRFAIGFSHQDPATDTVAVDLEGRPFRDADDVLLFRPGGHGALLDNLGRCAADLVYVKNIDNVVPDHLKGPVVHWKKVLGGLLATLQERIFAALRRLDENPDAAAVDAALTLLRTELGIVPPDGSATDAPARLAFARARLDRPLRVCGMVPCEGDPGGGPFWVRARSGETSLQIVETAQIDTADASQQAMLAGSTYFNPVDLACGLRDHRGKAFDLARHVDPEAVFISEKSSGGRKLRALERPGLWNGSMADWTTVFVAVPAATFNPVKTINDLLKPQHQPPAA